MVSGVGWGGVLVNTPCLGWGGVVELTGGLGGDGAIIRHTGHNPHKLRVGSILTALGGVV